MERLKQLYFSHTGKQPLTIDKLPAAGSNRAYYRIKAYDGSTMIGVIGTSQEENHAFIYLARHFRNKNLPVPEVYAVSDDESCYLQQDLGSRSLFDALKRGREAGGDYNDYEKKLLLRTIRLLPKFQFDGAEGLDWSVCYPQPYFDRMNVMFDLNYFKYMFLKPSGVEFHEVRLERDFQKLADILLEAPLTRFMYRDFQARNVMLDENDNPYFIDFQGGRRGPAYYDIVSFLWQASARYSDQLRRNLLSEYMAEINRDIHNPAVYGNLRMVNHYVIFRILQVLGAYGFRGYFERKQHFIDSIPPALENLQIVIDNSGFRDIPYLGKVCQNLINAQPKPFKHDNLIVRVYSFSYKKGIPADISGNGGGHVFDCRASNNPGRYAEYKKLTGRDKPVIDFLEKDGEILQFLDNVYPIVDFHVQRWIDRGFKDLQISFGCTGGQHRSVYSAQHVAEHIHKKFGVEVHLCHRERGIKEVLK